MKGIAIWRKGKEFAMLESCRRHQEQFEWSDHKEQVAKK